MFIKKSFASLLLVVIFWSSSALSVSASSVSAEQNRVVLLAQIERLLNEVLRLQAILAARVEGTAAARSTSYVPYQTVFFPLSFESIYLVDDGLLFNTDKNKKGEIRLVDEQMFDLFTKVIGKKAVSKYVQEWRVFKNNRNDLGAFVESIAGTDRWVVGANRDGFSMTDILVTESFANLFVHEYAHILTFYKPDFEESFKNNFWIGEDFSHAALVGKVSTDQKFDVLRQYFENNKNRFVSDYSTMSYEEDVAETFVSFVREGRPTGNTVRERKILAFYQDQDFVDVRLELRDNLRSLGVLK